MNKLVLLTVVVLFVAAPASAGIPGLTFFSEKTSFESFNLNDGKYLKGVEDFEESTIPDGAKLAFPAPLANGVANIAFPQGISAHNLIIQDNTLPGPGALVLSPSGNPQALFASGAGFFGGNSKKIGEDMGILNGTHVSTDLIFLPNEGIKTGVGFDISRYAPFNVGGTGFVFSIFDINNVLLGMHTIPEPADEPGKTFFGVWAPSIGRINIHDTAPNMPEGIDNIQMWVPEPATVSLLLLGALIGLRRKR